nr:uncharacterized protein LOC129384106 [Dermacentor andersoni]
MSESPIEGASCTICMGESGAFVVASCGHCYHHQCLTAWLEETDSCPVCRRRVNAEEVIRLHGGSLQCSARPRCVVALEKENTRLKRRLQKVQDQKDYESYKALKYARLSAEQSNERIRISSQLADARVQLVRAQAEARESRRVRREAVSALRRLAPRSTQRATMARLGDDTDDTPSANDSANDSADDSANDSATE